MENAARSYSNYHLIDRLYLYAGHTEKLDNLACAVHWGTVHGGCNFIINRTDPDHILRYEPIPVPVVTEDPGSMEELLLRRATELWSLNRPLRFLWSGGMDSTGGLVALMRTNDRWYDQLEVRTRSHVEYPWFYEKYLKGRNHRFVEREEISDPKYYYTPENHFTLTGDLSDQLFGGWDQKSNIASMFRHSDTVDIPIKTFMHHYYDYVRMTVDVLVNANSHPYFRVLKAYYNNEAYFKRKLAAWIENHVMKCPIPIVTPYDFLWWIVFTMRWHEKTYKLERLTGDLYIRSVSSPFYDTTYFQQWAIYHHEKKLTNRKWSTFKNPLKKFILDYTKDADYFFGMRKNGVAYFSDREIVDKSHYIDRAGNQFPFVCEVTDEVLETVYQP